MLFITAVNMTMSIYRKPNQQPVTITKPLFEKAILIPIILIVPRFLNK